MKETTRRWLELAQEDLKMVELASREARGGAAFHLQQAAEKLIKALLEDEFDAPPPKIHDLAQLLDRLPADNLFKYEFDRYVELTPAVEVWRYPGLKGPWPEPPDSSTIETTFEELVHLRLVIEEWLEAKSLGILP